MKNNDSFEMINDIVNSYTKGSFTLEDSTRLFIQSVSNYTWFIDDINIRIKAQQVLYKRYFNKMINAIKQMERK